MKWKIYARMESCLTFTYYPAKLPERLRRITKRKSVRIIGPQPRFEPVDLQNTN